MTRDTGLLNDTALDTVAGGLTLAGNNLITHPNLPRSHDLLTPTMIAKLLAVGGGIVPQIPRS